MTPRDLGHQTPPPPAETQANRETAQTKERKRRAMKQRAAENQVGVTEPLEATVRAFQKNPKRASKAMQAKATTARRTKPKARKGTKRKAAEKR